MEISTVIADNDNEILTMTISKLENITIVWNGPFFDTPITPIHITLDYTTLIALSNNCGDEVNGLRLEYENELYTLTRTGGNNLEYIVFTIREFQTMMNWLKEAVVVLDYIN